MKRGMIDQAEESRGRPPAQEGDLVSVIIPTYNYVRFLPEAVDSALAQTWRPLEILIVDDGSTDGTQRLVEERYRGNHLVRYLRQENQGLSAARNTGIRESRGKWLVFLDADDRLLPRMIEVCERTAECIGDEFALVASQARLIDLGGSILPERHAYPPVDVEIRTVDLLVMNRFGCTVLARRSAFEVCGGFDTQLRASEDRDMWIRISRCFRLYRIGDTLYEVRRHGDNMSGNGSRQAQSIRKVLDKARRHRVLTGWRRFYWLKIVSHFLFQVALLESRQRTFRALCRIFGSILLWPCFLDRRQMGQVRPWFRLRTIGWILREKVRLLTGKVESPRKSES